MGRTTKLIYVEKQFYALVYVIARQWGQSHVCKGFRHRWRISLSMTSSALQGSRLIHTGPVGNSLAGVGKIQGAIFSRIV